jgi:hypothetical protein
MMDMVRRIMFSIAVIPDRSKTALTKAQGRQLWTDIAQLCRGLGAAVTITQYTLRTTLHSSRDKDLRPVASSHRDYDNRMGSDGLQ